MPRAASAILVLLTAGCAAPEREPVSAFGGGAETLLPPPVPGVEAAAPRTEAELRNDLANGGDPIGAALALVALLEVEERLPEALPVLATAAARAGDTAEGMAAKAGVLRDLGRRRAAMEQLILLQREHANAFGPGLCLELAELAYLEGEREVVVRALRDLRAHEGGAHFLAEHDFEVRALEQASGPVRTVRVRDLLADLRGAEDAVHRLAVFERLVRHGGEAASRASCIAVGDPDPRVRSAGVDAAEVSPVLLPEFCAKALSDPAGAVRASGARRCAALPRDEAVTLLLPVLAVETDAMAFAAMHSSLRELCGGGEPISAALALDEATRAAAVAHWQERFAR